MKTKLLLLAVVAAFAVGAQLIASPDESLLDQAKDYRDNLLYVEAESTLSLLAGSSDGRSRQQALFLMAGLKTSAREAGVLYRRIIDDDPRSEWAKRAQLELSKLQYALGNYEEALRIVRESDACDVSDEACLFYGLSAIMLDRFAEAKRPLSRIRRGKFRTWAYLSLAEVESGLEHQDEACRRYESLSNAMINPTALYRYAECLEDDGEVERASDEFSEIIKSFRGTPEAVLAAEKLQLLAAPPEDFTKAEPQQIEVLTSGFTLQFGSFRDRGNAIKLATRIKRVYPGVRVDSELINYREHHRVRFGYYRTREEAQVKGEQISREMNEDYTIMSLP